MFQNSYQNGTYFELFDPKASQEKTKNLYRVQNSSGNNKIFDKQLKTYVLDFNNANARITFPKQDRKQLYLIQQFLNLQILFVQSAAWSIELTISDLNKTKRRITLSANTKLELRPFFVKFPCAHLQEGIWTNLAIDLYSFISAFKGQAYRSLDNITISGFFRLRRIYTTQQQPLMSPNNEQNIKINLLPKALCLPPDVQCANCLVSFEQNQQEEHLVQEHTEQSTKSRSNIPSNHQLSTPKASENEKAAKFKSKGYKGEKKFLAETDGPDKKRKKLQEQADKNRSRYTDKVSTSIQKRQVKGKTLGKTNPPKNNRMSVQKSKNPKQEQQIQVNKKKVNPWRAIKKNDSQTDGGTLFSETKPINSRKIESAETTLFKTKNKLANRFNQSNNKGFDQRSDQYSDSQYVELSQKFSTLTQGKFFKNQLASQHVQIQKQPDEIEQNIELQSNQMNQSVNRKRQQTAIRDLKCSPIAQSINDSLDDVLGNRKSPAHNKFQRSSPENLPNMSVRMMNSYYGFGEKLMNKYMDEVERPYSPPLCQKELTEEASEKHEDEKEVEVIYDPVLNFYYDHKTHTYYELKN